MDGDALIDRDHLAAQTAGDAALARELLGLFRNQCGRLLPDLLDPAVPPSDRADIAHTLKGSALGIGAARAAAHAAEVERCLRVGGNAQAAAGRLAVVLEDTLRTIGRLV